MGRWSAADSSLLLLLLLFLAALPPPQRHFYWWRPLCLLSQSARDWWEVPPTLRTSTRLSCAPHPPFFSLSIFFKRTDTTLDVNFTNLHTIFSNNPVGDRIIVLFQRSVSRVHIRVVPLLSHCFHFGAAFSFDWFLSTFTFSIFCKLFFSQLILMDIVWPGVKTKNATTLFSRFGSYTNLEDLNCWEQKWEKWFSWLWTLLDTWVFTQLESLDELFLLLLFTAVTEWVPVSC